MKTSNSYINSFPMLTIHNEPTPPWNGSPASAKPSRSSSSKSGSKANNSSCSLGLLTMFVCVSMLEFLFTSHPPVEVCKESRQETNDEIMNPMLPYPFLSNLTVAEESFWKQPEGPGYQACTDFSSDYNKSSVALTQNTKRNYLMVVVSGGLNRQRNQIVDGVVIARILQVVLVAPILNTNKISEGDSEFSDIFDINHFKKILKDDVTVVATLPSTHIMSNPTVVRNVPENASPEWIRQNYLSRFNDGVLVLRGFDSRLSKDLPPDLQKLRCKVAFQALRFTTAIQALGDTLAQRMTWQGPYLALHLRLEKDVWVRTGCSPGLGVSYDEVVTIERRLKPQLPKTKTTMSSEERRIAGQCPLNAEEIARLLKALGASERTPIYWAGGQPLGGISALKPLSADFPLLFNKETLALPDELESFKTKASILAAIDYVVCLNSHVFIPSHGGNMGRLLKGNRAYAGLGKTITPNKRLVLTLFRNTTFTRAELDQKIKEIHEPSHQTMFRTDKGLDVLAYPIPDCLCRRRLILEEAAGFDSVVEQI